MVDDESGDETAHQLARLAGGGISVIRHATRTGVSRSRNDGLEGVETKWVVFLDDDDVWSPEHLQGVLAAAESRPGIDIVCSGSVTTDAARRVTKVRPAPDPDTLPEVLTRRNELGTPSRVLMRTTAVRAAGGFDEQLSLAADWDMWLRLARPGVVAVADALTVGDTEHGDNLHLAADVALRELPRLEERYAAAAAAQLTDHAAGWMAASYRRSGQRRMAARWYFKSWRRGRDLRDLGRAAGVLLGERAISRSGLQRPEVVPEGLAPWLDAVREVDGLPPDQLPF